MRAAFVVLHATAQDTDELSIPDEVRADMSDAKDAIATYCGQERDQVLAAARGALNRLDTEIERREQSLRAIWSGCPWPRA